LVQQELHPQDERREGDGDPRQPNADAPPAGISEAVEQPLPGFDPPAPAATASVLAFDNGDGRFAAGVAPAERQFAVFEAPPRPEPPRPVEQTAAIRLDVEDRSSVIVRRLELWRDEFVAWVKTLASAAVYATLIVTFGFQVARVEGQSMAPTLADQDRLIVNKLAYRLADPQRGDIVMLYYPLNPDKSFVKRVIAEENDTVRIVDGRVYVNDVPLLDDYVPPEYRSHDDWGPQVIPEGYYFVMGDHRNNSSDSRHWGFVPKKYIIGKVQLRWWPVPNGRVF
jgi:signal peptidase I